MEIGNESQAGKLIEAWRALPDRAQERQLRSAIETLELNLMYQEQKGRDEAARRTCHCLDLLQSRLAELRAPAGSAT